MPCIQVPDGIVCFSNPAYTISDGKTSFTFIDHDYCGPARVNKKTHETTKRYFGDRSKFWSLYTKWRENGKMVDQNNNCILEK